MIMKRITWDNLVLTTKLDNYLLLQISILSFVLFMPFGYKLAGRFAISNIGQIISFVIAMPVMFRRMKKRYLYINMFFSITILMSAFVTSFRYNISMHMGHILFFIMIGFYISYFVQEIKHGKDILVQIINDTMKIASAVFFVPYLVIGIYDILILKKVYSSYMFDDKSHAVLFFSFFAFVVLKLFKGNKKYVFSIVYFLLSLTTTSRLGVIFIPFYIMALYKNFVGRKKGITRKIVLACVIFLIILAGCYFVYQNMHYFSVFGRINTSSGSTKSHIMLIVYAVQIKFANLSNFLIGAGPGSFSNILVASRMDLSGIMHDTGSYYAILEGRLPVHSSHFEIFMDFSIVSFYFYVKFLIDILGKQIKNKQIIDLLYFIPFMGAEMFYSTFHEVLFFVIILYLFANCVKRNEENGYG